MTAAFQFHNFLALPYELQHDQVFQNILGRQGFTLASTLLYRLRCNAVCMFAPVCSTWTYLARSGTLRCMAFPLGYNGYCRNPSIHIATSKFLRSPITLTLHDWLAG